MQRIKETLARPHLLFLQAEVVIWGRISSHVWNFGRTPRIGDVRHSQVRGGS